MKIRGRIYSVILVLLLVFFVWLRGVQDLQPSQGRNQPSIGTGMQKETLYVWYTDEALTDYMNSMALSYMEAHDNIRIVPTLVSAVEYVESINQATMGLLFLQLMNHMDKMETDAASEQQKFIIQVLSYVEEHYKSGELTELAEELHFDIYWLSKEIRKRTGKTYTDLVQAKRLSQAAYLLRTTAMNVIDISMAVGYDNISYFHRIFQKKYGMTPRRYRISE